MAVTLSGAGLVTAIIITTVVLTVFGAIQGYVIDKLRINSLVLTIGTLIGMSGAAYIVAHNTTVAIPFTKITEANGITQQMWDIFSPMSLIAISLSAVAWAFLTYTRPGREIYALGGGRREALAAGVATRSRFVVAFACSAGAAALAGSLVSVSSGGADPVGIRNLLLSTITAVLVGGVSLTGGIGSVVGICVGALTIQSIIAGVAIEGANSNVSDLLIAGLLVCVLGFDAAFRWMPRRRPKRVMTVDDAATVGEG